MSNKRDLILTADDIVSETMTVPEWGDVVIEVRSMTASERMDLMEAAFNPGTQTVQFSKVYGAILTRSVYDPDTNELLFQPEDEAALGNKNGGVVERIAMVAMRLAGMTEESEDAAGNDSSETQAGDT